MNSFLSGIQGWFVVRIMLMCVALVLSCVALAQEQRTRHNIMDYGAVNDRDTRSTIAIQAAIDSSYFQGGGTVYVPAGDYLIGTIVLKDNVNLLLEEGATLHASRDINDYRMPLEDATRPVLIYANGAKNISIRGKGTIHGHAERVYEDLRSTDKFIEDIIENARTAGVEMKQYYVVPPNVSMCIFSKCENVTLEDVSLVESTFWTLHLIRSDHITIRGLNVFSDLEKGVNSDGIDINSCNDVTISDCTVKTGDDAIVLKTWYEKPCENVTVTNCHVSSSSSALKLGTESWGDFRHIVFSDCVVENSNRGLSIVVRSGAAVEDVTFSNIHIECRRRHFNWWGNGDPIWIYLTQWKPTSEVGYIKDVVFENITATGMGTSRIESTAGMRMENIRFNNVQFHMQPEDRKDKRADHAFEASLVRGLHLKNVRVTWEEEHTEKKWRSALVFSDVEGLTVNGFTGRQGLLLSDAPVMRLRDVRGAVISNCNASEGSKRLVEVTGATSKDIVLRNNEVSDMAVDELRIDSDVELKESIKKLD